MERDFSRSESILEAKFLLPEQIRLRDDVGDLSLQFRLPVVDVMQALRQTLCIRRLCPQRKCLGFFNHVACNVAYLAERPDNYINWAVVD